MGLRSVRLAHYLASASMAGYRAGAGDQALMEKR